ncbi:hypothetical protein AMTR_s00033p00241730 [Amborella trichopoda]|uniref:Uncharacterized protein n=1 Tax=Amborella trichopoda TaxID=13333 RepID=U5CMQ2_AMBTC|nr:hypothetical protein AMTR_s00033p00241730 [Amborella trichopoda]
MVSDSELVERLKEFLSTADLNTTTNSTVRKHLENEFGVDLSEKKAFIRDQINLYFDSLEGNEETKEEGRDPSESEGEEDRAVEEEEEKGKGSKRRMSKDKKRTGGGGFSKPCGLSPELQAFMGVSVLPRTEVVKRIWAHIREHNLQDPANKRNIICDEQLRSLFDVDSIGMFQMNKVLSKHILPLATENGPDVSVPKVKPDVSVPKVKRQKQEKGQGGKGSALLAPLPLSDALIKFIGTGENALPRSEVIKRIWNHIKQNELQDNEVAYWPNAYLSLTSNPPPPPAS